MTNFAFEIRRESNPRSYLMDEEKMEKTEERVGEKKERGCAPRVEGDERATGVEEAC